MVGSSFCLENWGSIPAISLLPRADSDLVKCVGTPFLRGLWWWKLRVAPPRASLAHRNKGINSPLRQNGNFRDKCEVIATLLSSFVCSFSHRRTSVPALSVSPWISQERVFFLSSGVLKRLKSCMFGSSGAACFKLLPAHAAVQPWCHLGLHCVSGRSY